MLPGHIPITPFLRTYPGIACRNLLDRQSSQPDWVIIPSSDQGRVMSHIKSTVIIGILVAAGIAAFQLSAPFSGVRSVLIFPLLPGMVAGLFFSGHGGNTPVAFFSGWIVDTGLYWGLWTMLSSVIRPLSRRKTQ
jgi:hypothetical protein